MNSPIQHSLLIDRATAAARPDEQAVRDWAVDQRVFVSSVIDGYHDYREAAVTAIEALGAEPVLFERFGGRDSDPNEAYLSEVRSSTIHVGLLGARYGRPLADRFSATHQEFCEAERFGLRTSMWVQDGVEREGPQQSFFGAVRAFEVTGAYSDPDSLRQGIEGRLRTIAAEDISPWVKLGGMVFRATEIEDHGAAVAIRATVRDQGVIAALRALTNGWGRRRMLLTYQDRTVEAEVQSVTATTRAARAIVFEIGLKASAPPQPTRFSFDGASWDELTQLAVRVSLFDEANPLGVMHHMAELPNPLPALGELRVSEESLRPIARLLLGEVLVVERGVERLTSFQLGRQVGRRRRLRLGWQEPALYTNVPAPPPTIIDGEVEF